MTQLSEVREQEEEPGGGRRTPHRFGEGFATGILAALVCMLLISTVSRVLPDGFFLSGSKKEEQAGAEVLTSQATADKLEEIQNLIQSKYLNEIDGGELSAYLFRGVAAGLDDAYARYYTSEELDSVQQSNDGAYYGIGATLSQNADTGEILVSAVYENSPAELGGLLEGDYLLRFNDTKLPGMELSDVIALIKEHDGPFSLTVLRQEQEMVLEMECGQVEKTTVQYEIKNQDIGYIRITEFDSVTVNQFKTAVDDLMDQGVRGLVFDLRDNPGGLLESVCDILDYILPEGLIVYTEDRSGSREEYRSDAAHYIGSPMAVLVNGNSASASEIFAGAVQDHGVGTIIGMPTYGKGVVQNTYVLSDGSGFKMTIEKYYTPDGQDIDGNGITPDIIVEEADASEEQAALDAQDVLLEKALEVLKGEGTENNFSGTSD